MDVTIAEALENIYTSVNQDNDDLDRNIDSLKAALAAAGARDVSIDPARLTHGNRQGRKMMQSYFRKRGVTVTFGPDQAVAASR